jgi:hypothetical protein
MDIDKSISEGEKIGEVVMIFLAFRNQLKLYHWQTTSFSRHQASDNLEKIISEQIDHFIEILQGSRDTRLILKSKYNTITFTNQTDEHATKLLKEFKNWLTTGLSSVLHPHETDLINIRDEMVANVNKTLYLYTLL